VWGSRALWAFVVKKYLKDFAIHDNTNNDDNDDLKYHRHQGALDDLIDDSQINFDLDWFSFLSHKIMINPHY
jgi:hypothetical protein